MTLFGKYFVQGEVLRMGNDSILDGLEEGVIIKDELTDEIIYINKAAKQMSTKKSDCSGLENEADNTLVNELFDEELKNMAYVDSKIFTDVYLVDTIKTIEVIQAINDYESFQSVIDSQMQDA